VEEAVSFSRGKRHLQYSRGFSRDVSRIASTVDDMFRNSPQPTKIGEREGFRPGILLRCMGNVKAFILMICSAVGVFAPLLVSCEPPWQMSIRERTREVAVLKTLGFTRRSVLGLFVSEAVALSLAGGLIGVFPGLDHDLRTYPFQAVHFFFSR